MHHHFGMHVVDPVVVVAAVAKRRYPRHRALLGFCLGNAALLYRGVLFLDDAERELAEMLQLDLLLLMQARGQLARLQEGNAQQPNETKADQGIDLSANGHPGPAHDSRHAA
jgi:hypothetical protein